MFLKNFLYSVSALLLLVSCQYFSAEKPQNAIARVGEKYLYKEDIASFLPPNSSKEDSINIVRKFINAWAVKELMLKKAQQNISDEEKEKFEKLITDYRSDLYINSYKENLVNSQIDTIVKEQELQEVYQKNKAIFKLNEDVIQLRYVELSATEKPKKISATEEKLKRFSASDKKELTKTATEFSTIYLNDSTWVKTQTVLEKLPFLKEKLNTNDAFFTSHRLGEQLFLVQVKKSLKQNDEAPIDYVASTLKQIILNQRKLAHNKKLEAEIINSAIKKNQFEIIYE